MKRKNITLPEETYNKLLHAIETYLESKHINARSWNHAFQILIKDMNESENEVKEGDV